MLDSMELFRDAGGAEIFDVYTEDGKPTGSRISYLCAERNGQHFTFGFNPDPPDAVAQAMAAFMQYLDLNGGKEVPDA